MYYYKERGPQLTFNVPYGKINLYNLLKLLIWSISLDDTYYGIQSETFRKETLL